MNSTVNMFEFVVVCSPIRSLIESGFNADKRSDVKLFYGARNLDRMAYQVCSYVAVIHFHVLCLVQLGF